jgi:ribose transport system substrate-binding protein
MRETAKRLRRPSSRRVIVGAASVAALAVVTATAFAIGIKPTGAGNVKTGTNCGDTVSVGPTNKSGVYSKMPKSLQDIYGSYPDKIVASPWATTKIKAKPPWKIGYIAIGISNPYNNDVLSQLKKEFAAAKARGLVTGDLQVNIPPSLAQSTPESQISAIKDMVRQGVNAIIVNPADSVAESPAMEAAGKAGVPIILADVPPAPGSKYQTSTWTQNQVEADAGTLGIIKKGDILIVRGIAGNQNDKVLYNQKVVDLKNCPDIHVASVLYGNWDNPTAKNVVSQYLASHPQPIAGVLNDGGMFAGIVQAFEARGIKVPPVAIEQCEAGDLSWWLSKLPDYSTVGGCINGFQGGYTYFNVALRILANHGPKYNVLSMPAVALDNTNLKAYAKPGLPLTSNEELPGPKTAWCDDTCLNKYFIKPGPATK